MEIAVIHSKTQRIPAFKLMKNDYWYAAVKSGEKLNAFYEKCAGYVQNGKEFCVHKVTEGDSEQIIVYILPDAVKEDCTEIESNIKQAENNKEIKWDYIDF